jgi:homoserine acetyltransferase
MTRRSLYAEIGEYTFYNQPDAGRMLWSFDIAGRDRGYELYGSLDQAMVAAVAEKWTGRRGAGGTAVDTAAGWFMRMIGAGRGDPS